MKKVIVSVLMAAVIATLIMSCRTTKLVDSKQSVVKTDCTYFEKKKIKFKVPEKSVNFSGNINFTPSVVVRRDTIINCPDPIVKPVKIKKISKDKLLEMQFEIDSLGNIIADCSLRSHEVESEIQEKTRVINEKNKIIEQYQKNDTWFGSIIKNWWLIVLLSIIGIVMLNVIIITIKGSFFR